MAAGRAQSLRLYQMKSTTSHTNCSWQEPSKAQVPLTGFPWGSRNQAQQCEALCSGLLLLCNANICCTLDAYNGVTYHGFIEVVLVAWHCQVWVRMLQLWCLHPKLTQPSSPTLHLPWPIGLSMSIV